MASPAAVLQILVTASTSQATASLARTDAQLKKTTATANSASTAMGTRMAGAAKMGAAAVGVGLVYAMGKAVKVGADFEKQMDAVGAVADANAKQMKALEKQALSLGQKTQYSAMEVAAAQEQLVKGGLKLKDVLGGALPASLSLAAAGQMELAEASTTTVNAMKLFGLQGKEAMNVADMLATAANKTTADVSDFAMALQQGGSAAKAAGYTLNDTITVLEALAEAGIKNSDAGTSMKTAFLQLLSPTEKQAALAEKLNLQLIDQNGNLKGAAGLSKELRDALGGMTNAQQAANLKLLAGTDGFRTLNALLESSPDKFREFTQANRENGTANDVAAKKMDNLAGSAEQLSGAVQTLAIKVSKWINPKLREAIDWMTNALTDLDKVGPGAAFGKKFVSAQEALFRSLGNVTDDQLYDIVASWDAAGKTIRKDQVTHWLALNKISADEAEQLFRMIDRFNQNSKDAFRLLAAYMKGTVTDGIKTFSGKTAGFLKDWSTKGQDAIQDLNRALGILRDGYEKTGDKTKSATEKMAEAGQKMAKSLKGSTQNVTGSFNSMVNATGDGLRIMGKNVSKALDAVGVKKAVSFSIEKVGNTATKGFQTGGVIVPGQGDGDKVPALLEPGEVVLNKKAVAAMGGANRVNSINKKVPRFAKGGVVTGDTDYVPQLGQALNSMSASSGRSIYVQSGRRTLAEQTALYNAYLNGTGNLAAPPSPNAPHVQGIAADISPGREVFGGMAGKFGLGFTVPSESWHIQLLDAAAGKLAASMEGAKVHIPRVLLKGPDGPLKSMGQAALDKTLKAARAYVASKIPTTSAGGGFIKGGGGDVVGQIAKVLLGGGLNRTGAAAIIGNAYQESGWNPSAMEPGTDNGGLWGFTTSPVALADVRNYANAKNMPWDNATLQSNFLLKHLSPAHTGYSQDFVNQLNSLPLAPSTALFMNEWERPNAAYANYPNRLSGAQKALSMFARGGVVQRLQKGGEGKKDLGGAVSGGKTDSAWKRFSKARRIAQRLKDILGERGRVAKIDESIGIAETLAGLGSSPSGSDLSPSELAKQIALNEHLLEVLTRARKLAASGMRELDFPKGMSTAAISKPQLKGLKGTFGSYLTDLTGVTGKGGRIFDTMVHLDELKNTNTASTVAAMDISGLRSVIQAAQFGVFNTMPKFHTGGVVPGAPTQEVPIMARGGEVVTPGGQTFVGYAVIDLGEGVKQRVRLEFDKRDNAQQLGARQYA